MVCDLSSPETLLHFTGNTNDSSGNGNNATNNGADFTTDKNSISSQALDFVRANSDYLNMNQNYDVASAFTINIFINPDTIDNNYFMASQGGTSLKFHIDGKQVADKGWRIYDGTGWHFDDSVDQGFTTGSWNMFTLRYDGDKLEVLKNAVVVDSDTGVTMTNGTGNMILGMRADLSGTRYYAGKMDEFRFDTRALTDDELTALLDTYDVPACPVSETALTFGGGII